MGAGAFYLGLSGGNVATERAFVMVSVMLVAVLIDRRALSLRAVALAALIVLLLRPEALVGPGFQMSFAATIALVAVFGWLRERDGRRLPGWAAPVVALVVSSAVAGAATAPVGAAHFNQISHYGLIANMVSVPLMGAVIIPAAVLSGFLAPLGFGWAGLLLMKPAISWILGVADWTAGLGGAVSHVPTPPAAMLPLFALGGVFLVLWQGRGRLAGLAPMAVALILWTQVERPPLLISSTGGLLGVLGPEGRALSKPQGEGFAAQSWLENDGDGVAQAEAADRPGLGFAGDDRTFRVAGLTGRHLTGRGASGRVADACAAADLVVVSTNAAPPAGCLVLDPAILGTMGGAAVWPMPAGPVIVPTAGRASRPWTGASRPRSAFTRSFRRASPARGAATS